MPEIFAVMSAVVISKVSSIRVRREGTSFPSTNAADSPGAARGAVGTGTSVVVVVCGLTEAVGAGTAAGDNSCRVDTAVLAVARCGAIVAMDDWPSAIVVWLEGVT